MTDTEIIKACAELDGYKNLPPHPKTAGYIIPNYLTSRDAIVPCVEKQPQVVRDAMKARFSIFSTAREICVGLIEETVVGYFRFEFPFCV